MRVIDRRPASEVEQNAALRGEFLVDLRQEAQELESSRDSMSA